MGTLLTGADAVVDEILSYQKVNKLKNHYYGAVAPADVTAGVIWIDSNNDKVYRYDGAAWSQFYTVADPPPVSFPEGSIIAWTGGYYTNGSNGGYTRVLGSANTVAAVNTLLNASGWYVCNGAAINLGTSTIHNGANRYIENLTDDRFLMGDTTAGGTGGSSTMAHTHSGTSLGTGNESSHAHAFGTLATGNESSHTHSTPNHTHTDNFSITSESAHTHGAGTLATGNESSHSHGSGSYAVGSHTHTKGTFAVGSHNHTVNPPDTQTGTPSATDLGAFGAFNIATPTHRHQVDIAEFNSGSRTPTFTGVSGSRTPSFSGTSGSGSSHNHSVSGSVAAGSSHNHGLSGGVTSSGAATSGAGSAHNHSVSGSTAAGSAHNHSVTGSTGGASSTENRPKYVSVFYIKYLLA